MSVEVVHKLGKIVRNAPNLLHGYSIFVDTDKLRLINYIYRSLVPNAKSFIDLGGVWKVNGAYSLYTLRKHRLANGTIVDTDFSTRLRQKLEQTSRLRVVVGDFSRQDIIKTLGTVDVAYFFDVLLHQANPSWDQILSAYASVSSCFVVYNQQYVGDEHSIRLTHLPLDQYLKMTPPSGEQLNRYAYEHATELHPVYQKPWLDIHNIFQWAITDGDLCDVMGRLGYHQVHFCNYGRFSNLRMYENHAFVFVRNQAVNSLRA